jgi:hypothetical protein
MAVDGSLQAHGPARPGHVRFGLVVYPGTAMQQLSAGQLRKSVHFRRLFA